MRVKYIFSSNPRAARLMAVISGIILALLLAVTLILWGIVFYQRHCWSPVTVYPSSAEQHGELGLFITAGN